ncbi:MAG: SPOR domain-containing protein [Gammaproteobacteria bacterium]|nr:SPOR domain-containing protein [Gammaproteobacteria bacterium]MCY4219090.1 SPOR domain-containing protein [Gammaproteobacteria bacterium]
MNTSIQYQLKHRLTGAVIIVLMGVILIPMILQDPVIPTETKTPVKSVKSVDSDEQQTLTRLTNIVKGEVQEAETKSQEQSPEIAIPILDTLNPNMEISEGLNDPKSIQKPPETLVMIEKPKESGDVSDDSLFHQEASSKSEQSDLGNIGSGPTSTKGWTVRVGTFAEKRYEQLAIEKLGEHNLTPKRTQVTTGAGQAVRVWLGPYSTEEEAKRVAISLKDITGQEGYVPRP